jgi:hypothetical protein
VVSLLGFTPLLLNGSSLSVMEWVLLVLALSFVPFVAFMMVLFFVNLLKSA